ncbi:MULTISPECIES: DUF3143 domain-containing protein [Prochlorococcus]|uniref:DUF3143 domain-containing protein n=1 Tax=Prochlorococcus TaxID=1218 RepID=UPI000309A5E3|nr:MULTISPECIES: DUF3143 domain-containing protein [Prochlorococcus]KGG10835.1 hypothetical protein EV04_1796 [Prochlorococcus marinus str. LG]KGG20414.1 hypothetical protein EV08_0997 [Prochlorococcus marinus str. SS2]KGG24083.1 hypothetical protein EV09_0687 [Prochlorococcus marinus str. SS35]KGG31658.1 hypothetical protein EV10_1755 [Prochlorococcus marinus str. SS51]KGG34725.1 hypothetical protein EV11_1857 [Prochlorococcus sp. SS52]
MTALEYWLISLGAEKSSINPCLWRWIMPQWSAEIVIEQDELMVVWSEGEKKSQFGFPYGLPREDVEAALKHGP